VLAEAMASGCAIVATETVGAKEVLVDNGEKCAKIVEVENVEKLAEAVVGFLSDENLRRRFGKLAQKSAVARFDQQRMIDETEKVYLEVLAKSA
jgi:glycosyltransferase involved in cell wall biosynthesis